MIDLDFDITVGDGVLRQRMENKQFNEMNNKEYDRSLADRDIPYEYYGWWRIIETSQWINDDIDIIGPALISLTGYGDRLRMFIHLAYVNCNVTKTGISFTWKGVWEYDPVSGTGSVKLRKYGRLSGRIKIKMVTEALFRRESGGIGRAYP
jgi:hypothetical protein